MAYSGTIHIGSYTFAVTPKWQPKFTYNTRQNETTYGITHEWTVEGYLVGANATATASVWDTLKTQIDSGGIQSVLWKVDGTTKASLTESKLAIGPIIRNLEAVGGDGEFANYVKFRFDVYGREAKSISGIVDYDKTVIINSGTFSTSNRTTFRVEGPSHVTYSRTLNPYGADLGSATYEDDVVNLITTANFEKRQVSGGTQSEPDIVETITISGGIKPINFVPIIGNAPFKVVGSRQHAVIEISGEARSESANKLSGNFRLPTGIKSTDIDSISLSEVLPIQTDGRGNGTLFSRNWRVTAFVSSRPKNAIPPRTLVSQIFT